MTDIESILRDIVHQELLPMRAALAEIAENLERKPVEVQSPAEPPAVLAMVGVNMIEADAFSPGVPPQRRTRAGFVASCPPFEPDRWISNVQAAEILGADLERWSTGGDRGKGRSSEGWAS